MKKLFALLLALALALPALALADPDVASMTDQELKDMITACSAELMARATVEPDGILLFEYDGFCVYQTGDAAMKNGDIVVPVLLVNNRDVATSIGIRDAVCNGWEIKVTSGIDVTEKAKRMDEIRIKVKDLNLSSLDDVESLIFRWTATEGVMYVFKEEERTEHRFW